MPPSSGVAAISRIDSSGAAQHRALRIAQPHRTAGNRTARTRSPTPLPRTAARSSYDQRDLVEVDDVDRSLEAVGRVRRIVMTAIDKAIAEIAISAIELM